MTTRHRVILLTVLIPLCFCCGVVAASDTEIAIAEFCGACHSFPQPRSFVKDRWRKEVEQGFKIYHESRRTDLVPPDVEATVALFEKLAPDSYDFSHLPSVTASHRPDDRFERVQWSSNESAMLSAVAKVRGLDDGRFLLSDMFTGEVSLAKIDGDRLEKQMLATLGDPCHVEPSDLDGDGVGDYVVTDLGSFNPEQFYRGGVWWLHREGGQWQKTPLKLGMSRVADARTIDYDNDGDQDLIVAEFGYRFIGSIHLATHQGLKDGIPQFDFRVLDDRNGATQVPVIDLNRDGRPDFVSLITQEHEKIEANINVGDGTFERKLIYAAPDAAYGSSGIQLCDLDADGDVDVLYCNGDTFDDRLAKPFHGIAWLENEGEFPFQHHHLIAMPGVHRAVAGDIDLDGDLDIAATSFLDASNQDGREPSLFDGIIWLEQTDAGTFVSHRILADQCDWPACDLVDVDRDGDLDLVAGPFAQGPLVDRPLVVYRNRTRVPEAPAHRD